MFAFKIIYSIASAILFSVLLSFVVNFNSNKINYIRSITKAIIVAMFVVPLYALFFFQKSGIGATVITSLYFIGTDWMSYFIFKFSFQFTGRERKVRRLYPVYFLLCSLDTISLLINIYSLHSFYIILGSIAGVKYWKVCLNPLHFVHIAFCYVMVFQSIAVLLLASIKAPYYYKKKYVTILISYVLIIGVNMVCYSLSAPVDFSILLYGILAVYASYCSAYKVPGDMITLALKNVNEIIEDGIVYFNDHDESVYVNAYAKKIFKDGMGFTHEKGTERLREQKEVLANKNADFAVWEEKLVINGKERLFRTEYKKLYYSDRFVGSFIKLSDITDRNAQLIKQKYIANHDELTGVFSRNKFFEDCNQLIKDDPQTPRYMIASNIQNFKLVNEVFGRKTGDEILKLTAQILEESCREYPDAIFGRISEDKFALFIRKALFNPSFFESGIISLRSIVKTSSYSLRVLFGISETNGYFDNAQILYDQALMAIKTIKNDYQRVYTFYNSELMEQMMVEQDIVSSFPDAIRNEQFKLYLQPIFDRNEKCAGAEALVYWKHPALGNEAPQYFLKILEDNSLIHVLDTFVIEKALQILKAWQNCGQEDKIISVNISTKDIYQMDVYEVVKGLVEKYGVNPGNLYLEFKETLLTADAAEAKKLLLNLQNFGVKTGIDNFGRGYSSLNLLKDVKTNFLKIDMLFLSETENEERSFKILKFIVSLAKTLNMIIISQGVETKKQCEMLQQLDCEFMQGYFYSKPLGITEFEKKYLS